MSSFFNDKSVGDTTQDLTNRDNEKTMTTRTVTQRMNKSYERMDKLLSTNADLHGAEMVALLKEEFAEQANVEAAYRDCCGDYRPVSKEIQRILQVIEDLANSLDEELVEDALKLESGMREKCDEIKRHKLLIRKLIG